MDWFGARVDGPLVVIRAIHFSATAIIAGSLIFRVVAEPALRSTQVATTVVRSQILLTAWIGLAIAAVGTRAKTLVLVLLVCAMASFFVGLGRLLVRILRSPRP